MSHSFILGKETFKNVGFSMSAGKNAENFDRFMWLIRDELDLNQKILMTSHSFKSDLRELEYNYIPVVRMFYGENEFIFNPERIFENCKKGINGVTETSDFVIWDSKKYPEFVGMTYARLAPILEFESDNGMMCIGTILSKTLILHGNYVFKKIKEAMDGKIKARLVACSYAPYLNIEGESLPKFIEKTLKKLDIDIDLSETFDVNREELLYGDKEEGNHVVVFTSDSEE